MVYAGCSLMCLILPIVASPRPPCRSSDVIIAPPLNPSCSLSSCLAHSLLFLSFFLPASLTRSSFFLSFFLPHSLARYRSLVRSSVQYAYLSPSNLSNAFPFFSSVSDVRSFDAAALNYFSDPYQFRNTKFNTQLGCYNASTATIRYQRTVLCSMWVNEKWSTQCMAQYSTSLSHPHESRPLTRTDGSAAATSQKMVCQSTCLEYSASEKALTEDQTYCPGEDYTNGNRSYQLNKDFVDCTNWTSLATNNTATCVSGDSSEGNCGYGTSTAQLCGFCQGSSPDDCCYAGTHISQLLHYFDPQSMVIDDLYLANTDVSVCGYSLPPKPSASSSASANPSATSGSLQDSHGALTSKSLSGGQIAGIVVGSVIGGLLVSTQFPPLTHYPTTINPLVVDRFTRHSCALLHSTQTRQRSRFHLFIRCCIRRSRCSWSFRWSVLYSSTFKR